MRGGENEGNSDPDLDQEGFQWRKEALIKDSHTSKLTQGRQISYNGLKFSLVLSLFARLGNSMDASLFVTSCRYQQFSKYFYVNFNVTSLSEIYDSSRQKIICTYTHDKSESDTLFFQLWSFNCSSLYRFFSFLEVKMSFVALMMLLRLRDTVELKWMKSQKSIA